MSDAPWQWHPGWRWPCGKGRAKTPPLSVRACFALRSVRGYRRRALRSHWRLLSTVNRKALGE